MTTFWVTTSSSHCHLLDLADFEHMLNSYHVIVCDTELCLCVRVYIHTMMTDSCKNVVWQGCGGLRGAIFYFLTTRSSQMNVEAADDVDQKY